MFTEAKEEYENQLKERGEEVTAEAMSIFYKDFLNKAYDRHMEYNRTWWKLNIIQLYPGFKAAIRLLKKSSPQQQKNEHNFWEKSFES
ncbi:uncharacterized protein BX663DRAFT_530374 [Cokeromyces recurvatus]|uniref:uncharacterized protein n=1 Tax=Cokeromyces recurvatus TaxID=90255 RepID=UPI00221F5F40|nr:uncharacterized protein BX663DRAFT_530374 [Cokeromyces recurvatus]KAI7904267.1 hypothetical protein BX663DRAFT_530374 [Cokeromyces recurvatus]